MLSRDNLHAYQNKAIDFIKDKKRCALFLDLGLGKTATSLTTISDMIDSFTCSKVLIIAPLRVANSVWAQEASKWSHTKHLRVSVVTGSEKKRLSALQFDADVYVINRENIPWLVKHYGKRFPFDAIFVDESSSFKNATSKRFKALKAVSSLTDYMVLLTGTPSPNGLIDLWSQMYLVDYGASLGKTLTAYRDRYFETDYHGFSYKIRPGASAKIHEAISDKVISMQAADYLELPEKIILTELLELPEQAQIAYDTFEKELFLTLADGQEIEAMNAAVLANKLLQFCSGATYTDANGNYSVLHDVKIEALKELVEQNDEPMLVAYNFKSDLERLIKAFPDAVVLDKDPNTINRWNNGDIKMLMAHPACLHPSTEVLTEYRGWVKIIDVKSDERVFDGVEFVSHSGCHYSGIKPIIDVFGIKMTHNHKLLIADNWEQAKNVRNNRDTKRKALYQYTGDDAYLSEMLTLRNGSQIKQAKCRSCESTKTQTLCNLRTRGQTSLNQYPHLEDMAWNGSKVNQGIFKGLSEVLSKGYRPSLVRLQSLLSGYVTNISGQLINRPYRQLKGLLKRKLPLDYQPPTTGEQNKQQDANLQRSNDALGGILQSCESQQRGNNTKAKQWNDTRASVIGLPTEQISEGTTFSKVYDLVDCGPRSRFVVRNTEGEVFISHNSAGHGLNLQHGGSLMVWFSMQWNLEYYQQFNARLYRQGQTKPVRIVHLIAKGCLDERVMTVLNSKDANQLALLNALKCL